MTTVNNVTTNTAFTDPTTVPTGCPVLTSSPGTALYNLIYGSSVSPVNYAACVQLPASVEVGREMELYGDYSNARGIVIYPAAGDTINNIPIGPSCGNLSVGPIGVRVIRKITATDWRIVSSVS